MSYDKETRDLICQRIAAGESLRKICEHSGFPTCETVFAWLREGVKSDAPPELKEFSEQYARAREDQAETLFDQCLEIADNCSDDIVEYETEDGEELAIKHSVIQRARLQTDVRKWMAGKLKPKKYGDSILNKHAGEDGGPVQIADVSEAEVEKRLAELLAKAGQQ